jgi:hypothetical protein
MFFLFLLWLIFQMLFPARSHNNKSKSLATHEEILNVVAALGAQAGVVISSNKISEVLIRAVSGSNGFYAKQTNASGQIVDLWGVPFDFQIISGTNFIIRSAGSNQKFGDADDIIFNSVSNDFVKP